MPCQGDLLAPSQIGSVVVVCDPAGGHCLEHPRPGCGSWQQGCQQLCAETHSSPRVHRPRLYLLQISLPLLVWVSLLVGLRARFVVSDAGGPSLDMTLGLSRKGWPFLVMAQT